MWMYDFPCSTESYHKVHYLTFSHLRSEPYTHEACIFFETKMYKNVQLHSKTKSKNQRLSTRNAECILLNPEFRTYTT